MSLASKPSWVALNEWCHFPSQLRKKSCLLEVGVQVKEPVTLSLALLDIQQGGPDLFSVQVRCFCPELDLCGALFL